MVISKSEVRMYDLQTGQLITILNKVFKQEESEDLEISAFTIDARHRKAYIGNNKGEIFVINSQNGVIIKNVTQFMEDQINLKLYQDDGDKEYDDITSLGSSRYSSDGELQDILAENKPTKRKAKKERKSPEKKDEKDEYTYSEYTEDNMGKDLVTYDNPEIQEI